MASQVGRAEASPVWEAPSSGPWAGGAASLPEGSPSSGAGVGGVCPPSSPAGGVSSAGGSGVTGSSGSGVTGSSGSGSTGASR